MDEKDKKWYLREIARMLNRDGPLNDAFEQTIDTDLPLRGNHGDEGYDLVVIEFEEKVLELFDY